MRGQVLRIGQLQHDELDPLGFHGRARLQACNTTAGAEIVASPHKQDYGSFYSARDPEGNLWSFGTYSPQLSPSAG